MSSWKEAGKPSGAGSSNPSPKGKSVSEASTPVIDQLSQSVAQVNLDVEESDGWEVYGKKNKNRSGSSSGKQWNQQNINPKAWNHPDVVQKLGMRNSSGSGRGAWPMLPTEARGQAGRGNGKNQNVQKVDSLVTSSPVVPSLTHGWNWSAKTQNVQNIDSLDNRIDKTDQANKSDVDDDLDVDDNDDDDDDMLSDEYDSDCSVKSHETRKKNRWFKELFECMDSLSIDQINDPERQWHCPACKGGPGAIDWYRGMQPLITHAKTKGSKRVNLHRELAQVLEEELHKRGTSSIPPGESFGEWEGLDQKIEKAIVWPPVVVIMNTRLEKDENDKWIGMGNQELLNYFSSYAALKARHSYGPQGHRGMSVLIFEASAVGYLEAERLSKHFEDNGRDKDAWDRQRVPLYAGGKRQLYGYMAEKRDLDNFNQHSPGKSKLKFEIRSYQEMVVNQLKQMSEENQQLLWYKNRIVKEQMHSKAVEESFGVISEKLRKTLEENRVVKLRTKMHHEQNKEQMDVQEQFFKEQLNIIYAARNAKEDDFEMIQQEQREKITLSNSNVSSGLESHCRDLEIAKLIECQDKEIKEFADERGKMIEAHKERMAALMRKHGEEKLALEEEFNSELSKLMENYMPYSH